MTEVADRISFERARNRVRQPRSGDGERMPVPVNDLPLGGVRLTVIVPARNQRDTIGALFDRLGPAIAPLSAEIIVVDDSDDDTRQRWPTARPRVRRCRCGCSTGRAASAAAG